MQGGFSILKSFEMLYLGALAPGDSEKVKIAQG